MAKHQWLSIMEVPYLILFQKNLLQLDTTLVLSPESIPNCLEVTAMTDDHTGTIVMGVRHKSYPIEGIQFHPESIPDCRGTSNG